MRLGVFSSNTKLDDYIFKLYTTSDITIFDKNLNENISNTSRIFSMYYIQKLNPKWSLHYEMNVIDQCNLLTDNVIVHYYKEGDLIAPLVEYKNYEIQREYIGLGVNFVYQSETPLSISLGAQINVLNKQRVVKEINYYDDYYLLKDVYGIDIYEENDPEDIQRIHLALTVHVKWKLFGVARTN